MLKIKLLIPVVAVVVSGSSLFYLSTLANAQAKTNPMSGLASAIASKYNLNQNDVQSFITSYLKTNRPSAEQVQKNRLDQLVKQGKITRKCNFKRISNLKEQIKP